MSATSEQTEWVGIHTRPDKSSSSHPEFYNLSDRIKTFNVSNWTENNSQTPEKMAEAGLYFTGLIDCTRCYHCGGGLCGWMVNHNPNIVHSRLYPNCQYMRRLKGDDFVESVADYGPRGPFSGQDLNMLNIRMAKYFLPDSDNYMGDYSRVVEHIKKRCCVRGLTVFGVEKDLINRAIIKVLKKNEWDQKKVTPNILATTLLEIKENEKNCPDLTCQGTEPITPADRKESLACKICLEKQMSITFLPCGHLFMCGRCFRTQTKTCPVCRAKIVTYVKTFVC